MDCAIGRFGVSLSVGLFALAGCESSVATPPNPQSAALTAPKKDVSPAYGVIYNFKGPPKDGAQPISSLHEVGGKLYGTTYVGGASNDGSIFAVNPGGSRAALYSLSGSSDGGSPKAGLAVVGNSLYGTASQGGANKDGSVFMLSSSSGQPVAVHSFAGYDGATPVASLHYESSNNTLYGTTEYGGTYNLGTVFEITPSGSETVLHNFKGGASDGYSPLSDLTISGGALYGTTEWGGAHNRGTVYAVSASGQETVVYSFGKTPTDGKFPRAGLAAIGDALYGTTYQGGTDNKGTVFKIASGKETVIHSFSGSDGEYPVATVIGVNGLLYGTASAGGPHGSGTVFRMTTSGQNVTVLHSFPNFSTDGRVPARSLTFFHGMLYGTTKTGGKGTCPFPGGGCGTVFALSP